MLAKCLSIILFLWPNVGQMYVGQLSAGPTHAAKYLLAKGLKENLSFG
jgi:hypothetical protein